MLKGTQSFVIDYTVQQTGPESTALPRRYRLSKIGPKSVLFVCPEPFVFSGIFVTGTKGKKYGFVCNAKLRVLQKRRDTPSSSIARAATAGYRCRWHRRSRSYSRQIGETARRKQCSNLKANMACKTANGRLDLSVLLRLSLIHI